MDALLAELDALGVTVGLNDGRPYLRVPDDLPPHVRASVVSRVTEYRDAVIAHLRAAHPEPAPLPDSWECVVCGREVDAATIPLLAGPHYCDRAGARKAITTADGVVMPAAERCPFKPGGSP